MKEKKLTVEDFDRIPTPGSMTMTFNDGRELTNAKTYAYQLGIRRGCKVSLSSDSKAMTLTITKLKQ